MKHCLFLVPFLVSVTGALFGTDAPGPEFSFEGPRIVGADFGLGWQSLKLTAGAGYENWELGRDPATGQPLGGKPVDWWVLDGSLGLRQTWPTPVADLWVAVGGMGYSALGNQPAGPTPFADLGEGVFGFAQAGFTRDRYEKGPHGVVEGTRLEAFAEAGPRFFSTTGNDYLKLSWKSSILVPLWNLDAPTHLLSGTLGLRANAQWIDGQAVPVALLEPTEVRGYLRTLDTRFRSVATAELRIGLPSLWGDHDLVPVVFAFAEGGWYAGYADSAPASDRTGWLSSVGSGLGFSVLGMATLTVTAAVPLSDGEPAFWWKPNFNLRF